MRDFENYSLDIYRLNIAIITLIPKEPNDTSKKKEPNDKEMKKFCPISLSNCAVKIFTKAMTAMASPICDSLISPNQTAFIKGRFIS